MVKLAIVLSFQRIGYSDYHHFPDLALRCNTPF
jgi:hypothetical protein